MQPHAAHAPAWATYIPFLIVPVVLFFRARRMTQLRPVRLDRLWIVPAIFGAITLASFAASPPVGTGWAWCGFALAAGTALGWQRGRTMRMSIDPATGTLSQRGSPAALLFLVALLAIRSVARYEAGAYGFNPLLISGALLSMALGLLSAQRLEMFLRGRRLLGAQPVL